MKSKKKKVQVSFENAVRSTQDVTNCYKKGLLALRTYSTKIVVSDTNQLEGSIDIDSCTLNQYPTSNRWDYAFSYKREVFFVEVHSAITSEVSTVIRKLDWLKDWLHNSAPEINRLKAKSKTPFYWIQSKKFAIPKTSSQYRVAIKAGLKPIAKLVLN